MVESRSDIVKRRSILPKWIVAWLWISTVICLLDVAYTMLRPMTLRGGALGNIYSDVDLRYADEKDLVTMATGRVMLLEIVMNIVALIMVRSKHADLTAFTSSAFVFWKTLLYLVMFIAPPEGYQSYLLEEAGFWRLFWVFWIADGVWVVMPLAVMCALWRRIVSANHYPGSDSEGFSGILLR
ncbi:unnamed protein product [Anisakis simplex]|uniref:Transmembrane protein n=1 Tax=Anisakis simplex TaxID=6269 RepID=A0A0M3J3S5_ANISI|nr:unnamed protein product [Anisakis simplex]